MQNVGLNNKTTITDGAVDWRLSNLHTFTLQRQAHIAIFVHCVSHFYKVSTVKKHPCMSDLDITLIIHPSHHSQHGICSQTALLR